MVTLKLYHSAVGAYSYKNAHPLLIKDFSLSASADTSPTEQELVFPMPECIYVDVYNNDLTLILPNINTMVGNVDPKTQIFRFKIRQVKGNHYYYHLKTFNNSSTEGGTIYNFQNSSTGTYWYRPGAWYMEVHYYLGNWYTNILN